MLTKILKVLYLIIGLAILFLMGREIVKKFTGEVDPEYLYAEDIIVGTKLGESLKEGKIPQGLQYETPDDIPNSQYKMLPLSALTYEQAKELKDMAGRAGDISVSFANYVNILFLDKDYNVINQLLDSLGAISDIEIPYNYQEKQDTTINNILYIISFRDTNHDSLLNSEDESDLYISNLDGSNLLRITSGINVEGYWFTENNSKVLIHYTQRTNEREEHKRKHFALYDIASQKFSNLSGITERINTIEAKLINMGPAN